MKKVLFESEGIMVWVEDGRVYEADERSVYDAEATEENIREYIEDAQRTVEEWSK